MPSVSRLITPIVNGLVLSPMRRTFATASTTMSPRIIDAIKQDHRDIESYYDRILKASDEAEQTKYQNQFTWELARHSIGEELVVYPAFEQYLSGGGEMASKDRKAHQSVSYAQHLKLKQPPSTGHAGERAAEEVPEHENIAAGLHSHHQSSDGRSSPTHQRRRGGGSAEAGSGFVGRGEREVLQVLWTDEDVCSFALSPQCTGQTAV